MIKDVEFAFFAQLSYLKWNNLNEDVKLEKEYTDKKFINFLNLEKKVWSKININKDPEKEPKEIGDIIIYHEEDKRLFGVYGIEKYSADNKNLKPLYNFDGWQFIYSADNTKLYEELSIQGVEDDGFFACAFMKDDDIVIAYRGTSDFIDDMGTNKNIAFHDMHDSQLVCTVLFVEQIKKMYPNKTINITGHSLGGCLAQYAYLYNNKECCTVTWNGLGVGTFRHRLKKDEFNNYIEIKMYLQPLFDYVRILPIIESITNKFIKNDKITLSNEKEDIKYISDIIKKHSIRENDIINNKIGLSSVQIYWLLRSTYEINKTKDKEPKNIMNYYNSKDAIPLLQTRVGDCLDVLTGSKESKIDDSKRRIFDNDGTVLKVEAPIHTNMYPPPSEKNKKLSIKVLPFHGVNDFLIFMDTNGKIVAKDINKTFAYNAVRTVYKAMRERDEVTEYSKRFIKDVRKGKHRDDITFNKDALKRLHALCCKTKLLGEYKTMMDRTGIRYQDVTRMAIKGACSNLFTYKETTEELRKKDSDEIGNFSIGALSNVTLTGIVGGKKITVGLIVSEEERKEIDRKKKEDEEEKAEKKREEQKPKGVVTGWGSFAGGGEYKVVKYPNGTIRREPLYD